MTNSSPDGYLELPLDRTLSDTGKLITASWWERQSIRFKTTVLALAIGIVPTVAIGSTAYLFAARSIERESTNLRKTLVADLHNQVNIFMGDRFADIKTLANLDIFTDAELRQLVTSEQKSAALQKFQDANNVYNSIGVFDAKGNLVAQTEGKTLGNHFNRGYVQDALKADGAVISQPRISTSSGIYSVYTAAPIKDRASGKTIGFVRARMPVEILKDLLRGYTRDGSKYYLLNEKNEVFLGSAGEYVIKTRSDNSTVENQIFDYEAIKATKIFADTESLFNQKSLAAKKAIETESKQEHFLTFAPAKQVKGLPKLNWQAIIATDSAIVFAPQRKLRQIFIWGTGIFALGVGAIAYFLANRWLRPILAAANAVREIGRGNLDTQLEIKGADEISQLSANINGMANQLSRIVKIQALLAQQSETVKNVILEFTAAGSSAEILDIAVREVHKTLPAHRVVYYKLINEVSGKVVAESTSVDSTSLKDREIFTPHLIGVYLNKHQQGDRDVEVVRDISQSDVPNAYRQVAKDLGISASLVVPAIVEDKLDGLLVVHQKTKRQWLDEEIQFIGQMANQIGLGITRLQFLERQTLGETREKAAREAIQSRALDLLKEVYEVSTGDLTIRAKVTEDEIGTIADSYNSTIESLQKLVEQTKLAVAEVQDNTSVNDMAVRALAAQTQTQAQEIVRTLEQVSAMEQSIAQVALSASQADDFVKQANLTIRQGDSAMNYTVAEINAVQTTVRETATKVQKLGESSQEISQAVNLVGRFAAQTHLLALKASIEAARAGEQGKGFAVIANEVRSLATQSAEATAEIETLVTKIQLETNELAEAMNQGTEQIAAGNQLVQQTRASLTQIAQASDEISKLVSSITQATQRQSATSARVNQTMAGVAQIAEHSSQSATQVSSSIQDLSAIAEKLQSSVSKFKT